MGPFESFVNKRCEQLLSITEYFPEYSSDLDEVVASLKSWINPCIIEAIEAKYAFLYEKLGIYPDTFFNWLQVSVSLLSRTVNSEMNDLHNRGMLPTTDAECKQIYREKISEQMARLYNMSKEDYLKACGGWIQK